MNDLDPDIHQPTRLRIMALLSGVQEADFTFLRQSTRLDEPAASTLHLRAVPNG